MIKFHIPVLLEESFNFLITNKSGIYFDATIGFGGHTSELILRLNKNAKVIATDVDKDAFEFCKKKFNSDKRVTIYKFNFSMIDIIAKIEQIDSFGGIFADLGVSSFQLDNKNSGFTYREDAPLDMRMDKSKKISAFDVINNFDERTISEILWIYGEEKNSKKIAKAIIKHREQNKITTTFQLNKIIEEIIPKNFLIKTLSRVYQAIRIYVNDELKNLSEFLENSIKVLKKGGRIAIISYHSLEDRIVKEFFTKQSQKYYDKKIDPFGSLEFNPSLKIVTKKPITPSKEEIMQNRRSRSAKLRVAEKI